MDAVYDEDPVAAVLRGSCRAHSPNGRAGRFRQPTLRWVESSVVPEVHSSSETPLPIRKSAVNASLSFSPFGDSFDVSGGVTAATTTPDHRDGGGAVDNSSDHNPHNHHPHHHSHAGSPHTAAAPSRRGEYLITGAPHLHRHDHAGPSQPGCGDGSVEHNNSIAPQHSVWPAGAPSPPMHLWQSHAPPHPQPREPARPPSATAAAAAATAKESAGAPVPVQDAVVGVPRLPLLSQGKRASTDSSSTGSETPSHLSSRLPPDLPAFRAVGVPTRHATTTAASGTTEGQWTLASTHTHTHATTVTVPSSSYSPRPVSHERAVRQPSGRYRHPQRSPGMRRDSSSSGSGVEDSGAAAAAAVAAHTASVLASLTGGSVSRAGAGEWQALRLRPTLESLGWPSQRMSLTSSTGHPDFTPSSIGLAPLVPCTAESYSNGNGARTLPLALSRPRLSCSSPSSTTAVAAAAAAAAAAPAPTMAEVEDDVVVTPLIGGAADDHSEQDRQHQRSDAFAIAAVSNVTVPPSLCGEESPVPLQAAEGGAGLSSPTLRALPKGWSPPQPMTLSRSPASSAIGVAPLRPSGQLATVEAPTAATWPSSRGGGVPACVADVDDADGATEAVGVAATAATPHPLESKVNAVFGGSAYTGTVARTDLNVLRALPVARTSIPLAAVEAAIAAPPLTTPRTSTGWSPGGYTSDSAASETPSRSAMTTTLWHTPRPCGGGGATEQGGAAHPWSPTESAFAALMSTLARPPRVDTEAGGPGVHVSGCSTTLHNPLSPATLTTPTWPQGAEGKVEQSRDGSAGTPASERSDAVSDAAAAAACRRRRRRSDADSEEEEDRDAAQTGDTDGVGPHVGLAPLPVTEVAALRFHSVLMPGETGDCSPHFTSAEPLAHTPADAEERQWTWSSATSPSSAAAAATGFGDQRGGARTPAARQRIFKTLLERPAGSTTVDGACGVGVYSTRSSSGGAAAVVGQRGGPPQRRNRNAPGAGPRREEIAVARNASRRELWAGLQLPRSVAPWNASFTNPVGPPPHSAAAPARRSGHEATMRRTNSDVCFGTFMSSAYSIRSSLEDRLSSFYLGTTINDRSVSAGTQTTSSGVAVSELIQRATASLTTSALTPSPSSSHSRLRWERGYGRSTHAPHDLHSGVHRPQNGTVHRRRAAPSDSGIALASASVHSSHSSSSPVTLSACSSILSFAFESSAPTSSGSAPRRNGARAASAAARAGAMTQLRSWHSTHTESTNTVTSPLSAEEAAHIEDGAECGLLHRGVRRGSCDVTSLQSRGSSHSPRHLRRHEAPSAHTESPPRTHEAFRRPGTAAKPRTVVVLHVADTPQCVDSTGDGERRHQTQQSQPLHHHHSGASRSGSSSTHSRPWRSQSH
ncbi:hypothetical protein NESM_000483500 [Novymonas esmeraldas]|uniref:Uncharacterized protein n=1 Tax=Novymonas esmeraldas TaxID=1808958 RepID=A0AAW0EQN6_9TRYP